jgi:SnoaL-like domain
MSNDDRIAQLDARLLAVEDRLEILQLLAAYGPTADSGSGDIAETLFTEDATYDAGLATFHGGAGVGQMINTLPLHRDLMAGGCAHTIDLPVVDVQGDTATAVGHGFLFKRDGDSFLLWRCTAVRWTFARVEGRWQVGSRVNRVLDGDPGARKLLRDGLIDGLHLTAG